MTDMGLLHYFLGIEVKQGDSEIAISQKKYAKDLLKKVQNGECLSYQYSYGIGFKVK